MTIKWNKPFSFPSVIHVSFHKSVFFHSSLLPPSFPPFLPPQCRKYHTLFFFTFVLFCTNFLPIFASLLLSLVQIRQLLFSTLSYILSSRVNHFLYFFISFIFNCFILPTYFFRQTIRFQSSCDLQTVPVSQHCRRCLPSFTSLFINSFINLWHI